MISTAINKYSGACHPVASHAWVASINRCFVPSVSPINNHNDNHNQSYEININIITTTTRTHHWHTTIITLSYWRRLITDLEQLHNEEPSLLLPQGLSTWTNTTLTRLHTLLTPMEYVLPLATLVKRRVSKWSQIPHHQHSRYYGCPCSKQSRDSLSTAPMRWSYWKHRDSFQHRISVVFVRQQLRWWQLRQGTSTPLQQPPRRAKASVPSTASWQYNAQPRMMPYKI